MDFLDKDGDEIEAYLKDNMAEGWLSEEENNAIEQVVEELRQLRTLRDEYLGFEEEVQEKFETLFKDAPYIKVM